jgi:hypothetical protein
MSIEQQHRGRSRTNVVLKGLLSYPLSGYQISGLLVDDLDLLVEHLAGEAIDRHAARLPRLNFIDPFLRVHNNNPAGPPR